MRVSSNPIQVSAPHYILLPQSRFEISDVWLSMLSRVGLISVGGRSQGATGRSLPPICKAGLKSQRGGGSQGHRLTSSFWLPWWGQDRADHTHCPEGNVEVIVELGPDNGRTSRGEHSSGDSPLGAGSRSASSVTPSPSSWAVVTVLMAYAGVLAHIRYLVSIV